MGVAYYSIPKNPVLKWLVAPMRAVPEDVQNNLIAPFFTSVGSAAFGAVSIFIFNLAGYIRHPGWAFFLLLLVDIVLFVVRFPLLIAGNRLVSQGRSTPTGLVIVLGLLWCGIVGMCNAACFFTDDYGLRELSIANMLGIVTGIVVRNHGCPRLAIAQLALCDIPFNFVLPFGQDRVLLAMVIASPLYVLGMAGAIMKLHRSYVTALLSEYENARRASFDDLTGLRNRHGLYAVLTAKLQRVDEFGSMALLYLDLDEFKAINDTFGHGAGDDLLRQVAERLVAIAPKDSIIARLGGDEFVVAVTGYTRIDAMKLGEAIIASVTLPYELGVIEGARVGISIGVALTSTPIAPDFVVASADRALYRAKAAGKGRVVLADDWVAPKQSVA